MTNKIKICTITGKEFMAHGKERMSPEGQIIAARRSREKYNLTHDIGPKVYGGRGTRAPATKVPTLRVCIVTGKEFMSVGRELTSPEGLLQRNAMYTRKHNAKYKNDPKHKALKATSSRRHRAKDPEAHRAYINNYMRRRPIEVDGVVYEGYNRTPQAIAYNREYSSTRYYNIVPKKELCDVEMHVLRTFQGDKCWICQKPLEMGGHLDHDPVTGEIRGLLCVGCNVGLGYLRDNPLLARKLADLLENGKLKRNGQINRILGRFSTPEALRAAADYLENPPLRQLRALKVAA